MLSGIGPRLGPTSGASPAELERVVAELELGPEHGRPLPDVLGHLGGLLLAHSTDATDPWCVAHLNTPPLPAAVAAEALQVASSYLGPSPSIQIS